MSVHVSYKGMYLGTTTMTKSEIKTAQAEGFTITKSKAKEVNE